MNYFLGIDPGQDKSAYIIISISNNKLIDIIDKNWINNELLIKSIINKHITYNNIETVIETIVGYGMKVGKTTFDTCIWAGRFYQITRDFKGKPVFIERPEVKLNLCHSKRAKDKNITQALKDRFGELGTKRNPGRLYNLKGGPNGAMGHIWSAFAVTITYLDLKYGTIE